MESAMLDVRTSGGQVASHVSQSRALGLLRCRLAWYGFRSVQVGPLGDLSERTLSVDLLNEYGNFVCRVEIDHQSGAIRRPLASLALVRRLTSLGRAMTGSGSPMVRSLPN
jgi:hypothetical protein